ncbi:MAG: STAS-like domain-containing protein [Hormoscilla sp. GUM202]|nr:STAS-like domain-containing protein [Hormoscilla sp. GM7CHS1pb]MBO1352138.1 STAS-like domain-containing protein [Hormoscilla sp. GUM202]
MNVLSYSPTQTENAVTIVINEVIEDSLCIACEDGRKLYEQIAVALRKNKNVFLSFLNCEDITPAFLSQASGQLYHWFPEDRIAAKIIDIQPEDADLIADVVADTKEYLEDPLKFTYATLEVLGPDYL